VEHTFYCNTALLSNVVNIFYSKFNKACKVMMACNFHKILSKNCNVYKIHVSQQYCNIINREYFIIICIARTGQLKTEYI